MIVQRGRPPKDAYSYAADVLVGETHYQADIRKGLWPPGGRIEKWRLWRSTRNCEGWTASEWGVVEVRP